MILTKKMIHAGKNGSGGWNAEQLAVLGLTYPPSKGWIARLDGAEIDEERYARFIELRRGRKVLGPEIKHLRRTGRWIGLTNRYDTVDS